MVKTKDGDKDMKLIFFRKVFIGIIAGGISSAIMLLIFTAVLSGQEDPSKLMSAFSLVSLITGAIVCGKIATIGVDNKLVQGLAAGVVFAIAVLLPSVIISDFDAFSILKMLMTVALALVGAMLGKKSAVKAASAKRRKNVMRRYAR